MESISYFVINNLILNMFIELSSKPITAAERIKHRFSFTDRSHQNLRTDATETFKSPFKAVKVIRKGRERQTVNGTKCIKRFKLAFTTKFSKMWPESFIAIAKDCTAESVQVYKPHRPPELFRIKVSFRNTASNMLFRTCLSRKFLFSPSHRLNRKH